MQVGTFIPDREPIDRPQEIKHRSLGGMFGTGPEAINHLSDGLLRHAPDYLFDALR